MMDNLYAMRHSLAHVLASAVQRIWPEAKFGVGPVISDGFYYDIDLGDKTISTKQLPEIEKVMRQIIKEKQQFKQSTLKIDQAIDWAKTNKQPYKLELLNDLSRQGTTVVQQLDASTMGLSSQQTGSDKPHAVTEVGFYTNGDFTDLCAGPHVADTTEVGSFKLVKVAGAYWRGQATNPQMIRVYGVAFETQQQLDDYLQKLEDRKARDHRVLGKKHNVFMTSELVGSGLPLWLENGATMCREIQNFLTNEEMARGYTHVITPDMAHLSLYKLSGHYDYYKDSMYPPIDIDGEQFMLRPMNCPHHFQIYNQKPRSYRDLPIRLAEFGKVYRYEKSGELSGLTRVRSLIINDGHIICRPDQARDEVATTLDLIEYVAGTFGLKHGDHYNFRLSLGDTASDKYVQDKEAWHQAEQMLKSTLVDKGYPFQEEADEGAFYGPKIDIQMITATGREETAFTIQYDFVMPNRFDLNYINEHNAVEKTVVIHRSLIGSIERFAALLIEHFAGDLPVWLAHEQLRLIPVNDSEAIETFARDLQRQALKSGIRTNLDFNSESVAKRIRQASIDRIPYTVVIGDQEISQGVVQPRIRGDIKATQLKQPVAPDKLLAAIADTIESKALPDTAVK